MKTITFFNNKGGVGKTSMVYHLAWMLGQMGHSTIAVDLDPQSNLTSMFLDDTRLEQLWPDGPHPGSILGAVNPLIESLGDIQTIVPINIDKNLFLLPGDLGLSAFEDRLSDAWGKCLADEAAVANDGFRVTTAFYRVISRAADQCQAEIALLDVGPNIGAMNRAAMVASDYVVIPLGADLFSIQGLRNLGPSLKNWRKGWQTRCPMAKPLAGTPLPAGAMRPLGYILLNPSVRENRPVKSYQKWADRIPGVYAHEVLGSDTGFNYNGGINQPPDVNRLAIIKHFKSLMPMAQEARKPMFMLSAADGAIGGHASAVAACQEEFGLLARRLLESVGQPVA